MALEVIKNKTVDIWLIQNKKTLKEYNSMVDDYRKLIQEEFNILKAVLEWADLLDMMKSKSNI